jgi:hypothetical protein
MTEAEIMELINVKRNTLEAHKAQNPDGSAVADILEKEIKELEASLAKSATPKRRKVFLDECAG